MVRRKKREIKSSPQAISSENDQSHLAGTRCSAFNPLSEEDCQRIYQAAKSILKNTGVEVSEPGHTREVFSQAGCHFDDKLMRVFIPEALVDECLAKAANRVVLGGRDGTKYDLDLSEDKVYLGTGGAAVNIIDLDGKIRDTSLLDNYNIGRLCDVLDNVHFYMRPVMSRDLANEDVDVNQTYACMAATKKHVMTNAYFPENVEKIRKMGDMIAGSPQAFDAKPIISIVASITVSPLRFAMETVEVLDKAIEHNIPVVTSSAPQAGATSPASLAGTVVQIMAEQLAGIVYVNLQKPGFPLIIGCVPAQADLRTGSFVGGSAEFALLNSACGQMARYLDLPIYNSAGIADSKTPDAQLGSEKTLTTLLAALSGSNYIHHSAGFLDSLMTVAYSQYVIDNDSNGQVMRVLRGIDTSDEAFALDVIDNVCRGDNHFLGHAHTIALMHSEYDYPDFYDRKSRDVWKESGAMTIEERANKYAKEILDNHYPNVFSTALDDAIRDNFKILLPREVMKKSS